MRKKLEEPYVTFVLTWCMHLRASKLIEELSVIFPQPRVNFLNSPASYSILPKLMSPWLRDISSSPSLLPPLSRSPSFSPSMLSPFGLRQGHHLHQIVPLGWRRPQEPSASFMLEPHHFFSSWSRSIDQQPPLWLSLLIEHHFLSIVTISSSIVVGLSNTICTSHFFSKDHWCCLSFPVLPNVNFTLHRHQFLL